MLLRLLVRRASDLPVLRLCFMAGCSCIAALLVSKVRGGHMLKPIALGLHRRVFVARSYITVGTVYGGHWRVYLVRSRITGGTRYAGRHFLEQMAIRSRSCFSRQSGKKHNLLPPDCGARLSKIGRSTICCHQLAVLDCQRCEKVRFLVPCLRCLIVKNGKNCDLLPPACAQR